MADEPGWWRRVTGSRAVRAGRWGVLVAVVVAAGLWAFNTAMRVRARREAARIAADTPFGRAFEAIDHEAPGEFGVLLLHGIHGTPDDFRLVTAELRARQIPHYAPMLGGERPSPAAGVGFTAESLGRHAEAAYAHLAARCGRIAVVGFSLGGVQATDVAARHDVAALALVAPGYRIAPRWFLPPSVEAWCRTLAPVVPLVPKSAPARMNDPAAEKQYRGLCTVALPAAVALADYAPEVLARCDRVTAPVLCVLSAQDEVIDVPTARAAVRSFASKSKRLVWCNDAAHTILSDTGRERAAREIVGFILSCRESP